MWCAEGWVATAAWWLHLISFISDWLTLQIVYYLVEIELNALHFGRKNIWFSHAH